MTACFRANNVILCNIVGFGQIEQNETKPTKLAVSEPMLTILCGYC